MESSTAPSQPSDPNPSHSSPSARSAARQHSRDRVLKAAARVLAEQPLAGATKERIGRVAGLSHQTVRDYFRTTAQLVEAVADQVWDPVAEALDHASGGDVAVLLAAYDALERVARARSDAARVALHVAANAGAHGTRLVCPRERDVAEGLADVVRAGQPHRDPVVIQARAAALLAAMRELMVQALPALPLPGLGAAPSPQSIASRLTFAVVAKALTD